MPSQSTNPVTSLVAHNVRNPPNPQNDKSIGLWGILNFPQLRDAFQYRLAREIPLKEGVP